MLFLCFVFHMLIGSTDEAHHQYNHVTSSVKVRICSTTRLLNTRADKLHHNLY